MNLVIISTEFEEKGISLCKELLNQNSALPIILVSKKRIVAVSELPLIGVLRIPAEIESFRILFHRAVGQLLCKNQIRNRCLNVTIGKTREFFEYESVISCTKTGEKVEIKCVQGIYLVACSLKKLKEKLPDYFIRINQRTIINAKEVLSICQENKTVVMQNREEFRMTQTGSEKLKPFLRNQDKLDRFT